MNFSEKLHALRLGFGLSQEQLAGQLHVTRQAVTKWESGQALPDLDRAIALSRLFRVTIDSLLLPPEECAKQEFLPKPDFAREALIGFLIRAKKSTYAAKAGIVDPCREASHDAACTEGDYRYLDTYLGGTQFSGEEAVWIKGVPVWAMNYTGRAKAFQEIFSKRRYCWSPGNIPTGARYTTSRGRMRTTP